MANKVYYGEYSLAHWIDLILKKNIILPPYQRCFVWKEADVKKLIEAFQEKQFVPPITIGLCKNTTTNYILDGQQRLTSILLADLGYYPKQIKPHNESEDITTSFTNENDDENDDDDNKSILSWTFKELTKKGKNKDEICKTLNEELSDYKSFNIEVVDKEFFLKIHFWGFLI